MNFSQRKRAAQWLQTGALLFAAASVLLRPAAAARGVLRGLALCHEAVVPALFPFLVLSRLLLESPAAQWVGLLLRPYTRLLGVPGNKAPAALLCGLLGGFACGARAVDGLYRAGEIGRSEAERLLVCAIGSGPGFVIGCVGAQLLGRAGAGWLLLAAQVAASLLCGAGAALLAAAQNARHAGADRRAAVACAAGATASPPAQKAPPAAHARFHAPGPKDGAPKRPLRAAPPAGNARTAGRTGRSRSGVAEPTNGAPQTGFVPAVQSAVRATIMLCGYVTLFSFFAAIAVPTGAPPLVRFFASLPLEVTAACRAACETAGPWRSELCCAALSAMGASVFFQVCALLSPEISLAPLLVSRLVHLPLALVLFRVLARLFPAALLADAPQYAAVLPAVRMPPDAMAVLFVLAALSCGALRGGQKRVY